MQKVIPFLKIKKLWKANNNPVQIYIHSAFCKSICKYCCYRGTALTEKNKDLYYKYFYKYLPKQINKYKKIISNQHINSIYFGGGTPNTEEDLANLIPAFQKLRDVQCIEKIIELHAGLSITDKMIELLKKEHFTTVILCQQTFDKKKLKHENRVNIANNDLDSIVGKFHNVGISVGLDLIVFKDAPDSIITDINTILSWQNKPDEITIALNYFEELKFLNIANICSELFQFGYTVPLIYENPYKHFQRKIFRFVRKNKLNIFYNTFYSFIPYLSEANSLESFDTSVLGIGSLPNMVKQTFSKIGNTTYSETWNGKTTKYTLYEPLSYKKQIKDLLRSLPDYIPVGTQIVIKQGQASFNKLKIEASNPIRVNIDFSSRFPSMLLDTTRNNFIKDTRRKLNEAGCIEVILNEKEMFDFRCLQ